MERLIQDLLDLARLREHAFSVHLGTVDLGAVAQSVRDRYRQQAGDLGVALGTSLAPDARALGDPDRIVQALSNLVENALRCTPRGGTVTILAAPGRLDVVDDGPGLAGAEVEHAFERFYLHARHGADSGVGTGLGLAIVAELADAMGGPATVRSSQGAGSPSRSTCRQL